MPAYRVKSLPVRLFICSCTELFHKGNKLSWNWTLNTAPLTRFLICISGRVPLCSSWTVCLVCLDLQSTYYLPQWIFFVLFFTHVTAAARCLLYVTIYIWAGLSVCGSMYKMPHGDSNLLCVCQVTLWLWMHTGASLQSVLKGDPCGLMHSVTGCLADSPPLPQTVWALREGDGLLSAHQRQPNSWYFFCIAIKLHPHTQNVTTFKNAYKQIMLHW